ncbi:MAG: ATPase, T2SS/T4P/T4SS family [Candidatus Binatia bacterium]
MIITIRQEGGAPRMVDLAGAEALIGKHADCQVVLADPKVSRRHARVAERGGRFFVEDLGSTNGTRVAGRAVQGEMPLEEGAELEIGPFWVSVARSAPTKPAADDPTTITKSPASAAAATPAAPTRIAAPVAPVPPLSGLGPLDPLLSDDSINEIMVNGPDEVFVERRGQLELVDARFDSKEALGELIVRIATDVGRSVDERRPLLDARLRDGSRVNAVLQPLAVRGPYLTVRRFPSRRLSGEELVANGSLSASMLAFLRAAVTARLSMLVSGGTGSGKTTLLAALCGFIGPHERVVTIEDAAELRLPLRHVLPLESRPADASGEGEVTIRDLVRNALRMRPDRIVVGEVRGAEALDMLQAMNTGHEGSLSTIHANSPREALQRLETLVLFAGTELPQRAIREQIAGAIPLLVHVERLAGGKRRVTSVEELTGLESGQFTMGEIFRFDTEAKDGTFTATGYVPRARDRIGERGVGVDNGWFQISDRK